MRNYRQPKFLQRADAISELTGFIARNLLETARKIVAVRETHRIRDLFNAVFVGRQHTLGFFDSGLLKQLSETDTDFVIQDSGQLGRADWQLIGYFFKVQVGI